jgi:GNAT superfamily N-acetyltransferase
MSEIDPEGLGQPRIQPGAEIAYTVTFLEMTHRPDRPRPHMALNKPISLLKAETPPVHFFRYLYDMVGRDYHWTDMHAWPDDKIAAFVQDEAVSLYVMYLSGWPAGFVMLDFRAMSECNVSYYGLAPEAIGMGYGKWLLGTAVHMAWDEPIAKLTVNTCSLDHPRALPTYQRWGFVPVRREQRVRRVKV